MIFVQWEQVVGLKEPPKGQTRRPVKEDEYGVCLHGCDYSSFRSVVLRESYRTKWVVGRTYAVQPGRGKKAVGRIRITKIRRERLGNIEGHFDDILAEGVKKEILDVGYDWFMRWVKLWESIYGKGAWNRMKDDDVWVLDFELVEKEITVEDIWGDDE